MCVAWLLMLCAQMIFTTTLTDDHQKWATWTDSNGSLLLTDRNPAPKGSKAAAAIPHIKRQLADGAVRLKEIREILLGA
jgi:beta-xylosidase